MSDENGLLLTSVISKSLQVQEWLCLNCQMQKALGGMEPPGPPVKAPQTLPSKVSAPPSPQKKETAPSVEPQQGQKPPVVEKPPEQPSAAAAKPPISAAPAPQQKPAPQQEVGKPPQQPPKEAAPPAKAAPLPQPEQPKQESGFFGFGFGGAKESPKAQPTPSSKPAESVTGKFFSFGGRTDTARARSPSPQPAELVSGKVMGFGSSIFSSASNLITSAVQDEPSPTPPTARKESVSAQGSAKQPIVAETKPPTQKQEEKKPEARKPEAVPEKEALSAPTTKDETPSKPSASQAPPAATKSSCPLCKVDLNIGSKDPPNYNTCTECKTTVCNLCGFNPMPHLTEVKYFKAKRIKDN